MTPKSLAEDGMAVTQLLLNRMNQGDPSARNELMGRLYPRLIYLTSVVQKDFSLLAEHPPESVFHNAWHRLEQAIEKERPATVALFFGLAAHKIRQVLLDMVEHERRRVRTGVAVGGDDSDGSSVQPPPWQEDSTHDPVRLAFWTELHQKVDELPPDEREVFALRYYSGLTPSEIASTYDIHPKQVYRLWIEATRKLAKGLPGFEALL